MVPISPYDHTALQNRLQFLSRALMAPRDTMASRAAWESVMMARYLPKGWFNECLTLAHQARLDISSLLDHTSPPNPQMGSWVPARMGPWAKGLGLPKIHGTMVL